MDKGSRQTNSEAAFSLQSKEVKPEEKLLEIFHSIKPDIVITFDEYDGKGHPDHNHIHKITMDVFNNYKTNDIQKLYFMTLFPKSYILRYTRILPLPRKLKEKIIKMITIDDENVTAIIKLKKAERNNKLTALSCHKSQFPDENGKYYKMPYLIFKIFSSCECYNLYGSRKFMSTPVCF